MSTIDLATYQYNITLQDKSFTSGMKNAEKQTEKLKGKTGELTNFLKTHVVAGITAVSVALGGMAIAGIKASDQLDRAMNKLQASTGATTKEMKKLEQSIQNIYGNKLGDSIDDIAQSMSLVKQVTGETGKELEGLTKNAILLKDTFGFEVNESIRAASALMKNFGISGDQAYTLIAEGAQNGANKNDDLLDTLNEYSIQFKSLGFNAEEFTNILIQGAQNGAWSIDKVGDAVIFFCRLG